MSADIFIRWLLIALIILFSVLLISGWPDGDNVVSGVSDSLTAISALMAVLVAFSGLNIWRRELALQKNMEIAEKIVEAVSTYRDLFIDARKPGYLVFELPQDDIPSYPESEEKNIERFARVVERRVGKLLALNPMIYSALLKAEIYWGREIVTLWDEVWALEKEYIWSVEDFFSARHEDDSGKSVLADNPSHGNIFKSSILFRGRDEDPFGTKLDLKIQQVLVYAKKKANTP